MHRIGRTARADTTGVALTFINEKDMQSFGRIEELIEKEVPKVALPGDLGEGPKYNPKSPRRKKRYSNNKNKGKRNYKKNYKKKPKPPKNN